MEFEGKTAVITGGAGGIGRRINERFRQEGVRTAVIDLQDQAPECELYFRGDLSEEKTLVEFAGKVIERFGNVDFLINNACLSRGGILSGCGYEDFLYVLKTGAAAPYMLTRLFLDHFTKDASVVNISSTRAFMSQADTESYTAAKGAITALTHALSVSLAGRARVNSISPGWINTGNDEYTEADRKQHPVKRIGKPDDIAELVLFLCSSRSAFISGENIIADGGMSRLMIYSGDHGWSYSP